MKSTLLYISVVLSMVILYELGGTIFPIMSNSECFQDDLGCLHNKNCPYKSTPWFIKKQKKINILLKKGTTFCRECFSKPDISKCVYCHKINLDKLIYNYDHSNYSNAYIRKRIEMYETDLNKNIDEWYQ